MGLIREPKDVDFYVDPRPLTKEEQKMISDYIKADKKKRKGLKTKKKAYTYNMPCKETCHIFQFSIHAPIVC